MRRNIWRTNVAITRPARMMLRSHVVCSEHSRPNWTVRAMSGLPRSRPLGRTSRVGNFVPAADFREVHRTRSISDGTSDRAPSARQNSRLASRSASQLLRNSSSRAIQLTGSLPHSRARLAYSPISQMCRMITKTCVASKSVAVIGRTLRYPSMKASHMARSFRPKEIFAHKKTDKSYAK